VARQPPARYLRHRSFHSDHRLGRRISRPSDEPVSVDRLDRRRGAGMGRRRNVSRRQSPARIPRSLAERPPLDGSRGACGIAYPARLVAGAREISFSRIGLTMGNFIWLVSAVALCLQWAAVQLFFPDLPPWWIAILSGVGVFGAAFLLSWAAEVAQLDIPQALALAFLALIAVLPEYAVDMYFAWTAGKDPQYTAYATANMTGANRLLIGVGWAAVLFTFWLKTPDQSSSLGPSPRIEIFYPSLATLCSSAIPLKHQLDWSDAAVLTAIFVFYIRAAWRASPGGPELEGPPAMIAEWGVAGRRIATGTLFLLSGFTIFMAAEPFAESLLATGRTLGVEEF